MFRFMIPLTLTLIATGNTAQEKPWFESNQSVASESQIKFAIESNYDDTGPGAKQPVYAYNTYKTLDEALVAYLDDPDTELPEHERQIALQKLYNPHQLRYHNEIQRYYPKTVTEYNYQGPPLTSTDQQVPVTNKYSFTTFTERTGLYLDRPKVKGHGLGLLKDISRKEAYALQQIQKVKGNPLSVAHYTKDPGYKNAQDQFNPHPKYTFSYGVNDKDTGDAKAAQETRDGGTVHGFYSFRDADGHQRTVHYTADDKLGFRANVHTTG